MANKIRTIGILLIMVVLSGCVKDGMEKCPEGNARIQLYVERFRNSSQNPLDDVEEDFNSRVEHLRYYLYRDGVLADQGMVDRFTRAGNDSYPMNFTGLEYGDYKLIVVANCTKTALSGDASIADNLLLSYPGCIDTEDFFTAVYPFSVNSNETTEHKVGLLRTHGVIRYTFKNLPSDVTDIEVVMKNVSQDKWVTGNYENSCEASNRYTIPLSKQSPTDDYIIGTFPTLDGDRSAYYLNLYRERSAEPYVQHMISDTLTVVRNQLLDIAVTFNDGGLSFDINLNSDWDGSSSGGEVGIE